MRCIPLFLALNLLIVAHGLAAAAPPPRAATAPGLAVPAPTLAFLTQGAPPALPVFLAQQVPQPAITCSACRTACKQACVGTGCTCMPVCSPPGDCQCNMICP